MTSNLAFNKKKADYRQSANGTIFARENTRKLFVIRILTSKPLPLRILQAIFANPAPVKAFRGGGGGGGYPSNPGFPQNETRDNELVALPANNFFSRFPPQRARLYFCFFFARLSRPSEFFFVDVDFFFPNTRPKILSTFFSCRGKSKACSICERGTLLPISLSARIRS